MRIRKFEARHIHALEGHAPGRLLRRVALVLAALSLTLAGSTAADARPTGWRSKPELARSVADAWAGYNDVGYVGRPKKSKKYRKYASRNKAAARKRAAKSRKKAFRAAVKKSGLAPSKKTAESGVKVAALGPFSPSVKPPSESATGGGIRWRASASCLDSTLASIVGQVAAVFGPVTVNSTCRSRRHNARVGGARRSQHLTGNAVDFRVRGNTRAVYAFLKSHSSVGGLKHYGGGLFHIDTGPRRTW